MSDLQDLARELRRALSRHARAGAWAVPGGASARAGSNVKTLPMVRAELGDCTRCKLAPTRSNIVFGAGNPHARLMFVGEAPGADEDLAGEPFVGAAGELLGKMIVAMGWRRDDVYLANVVKCRTPGDRDPESDEVASCQPFLDGQLAAVAPLVVVALGRPAANALLDNDEPIGALRGRFHDYRGLRIMPTYHPAYLLTAPEKKREAWNDLQMVIAELAHLGVLSPSSHG